MVCSFISGCVDGALASGGSMGGAPWAVREAGNALGGLIGAVVSLAVSRRLPGALDGRAARAVPSGLVALLLASWFIGTRGDGARSFTMNALWGLVLSTLCCLLVVECCGRAGGGERLLLRSGLLCSGTLAGAGVLWQLTGDDVASPLCLVCMVAYLFVAVLLGQRDGAGPGGGEGAARRAFSAGGAFSAGAPGGAADGLARETQAPGALAGRAEEMADAAGLSPREREVMAYLLLGHSAPAIAERMGISLNTVKTHAARVYRKLDVHTREELYAAVRDGGVASGPGGCGADGAAGG